MGAHVAVAPPVRGGCRGSRLSTMSAYGATSSCLPGDLTDEAFSGDLSELGWKGKFKYDDAEVVALRVRRVAMHEIARSSLSRA